MLLRLAHALETLLGPSLGSAAVTLSRAAAIALIAAITIALARAAVWLAARRYGWERAWIVRCPQCGRLAADPRQPSCPSGHKLRFPPGSARGIERRGRRARAAALYAVLLSLSVAAAAWVVYSWLHVGTLGGPLARVCAALAYFFFLAALYAGDFAVSPRPRGAGARMLHIGLALACLTPFILLALLSRAFQPAERRVEGFLWATPAGIYISDGKARRLAPAASTIEARLVEARLPEWDLEWRGLAGFRAGTSQLDWKGRGGFFTRWLDRSADSLRRRGILIRRFTEEIPLPPNVRVQVVRSPEGFDFEPETK